MRFSLATRRLVVAVALAGAGALVVTDAFARPGQGRNQGSRGSQTYSAPAATPTAPRTTQGMERSAVPQQPARPAAGQPAQAQRPGAPAPAAAQPSMARNIMMGVGAGLLGAGLFGLLSGSGFFAGLGSLAGMFGFLLQLLLIGGLVYLIVRLVRGARQPQPAGGPATGPLARDMTGGPVPPAGMGGGMAPAPGAPQPIGRDLVGIGPSDYHAFEKTLLDVQAAYSADDRAALGRLLTPEMRGYFEEELDGYLKAGQRNLVEDVQLMQGDLSEAWREDGFDYATVALRFGAVDRLVDRASGREIDRAPFTEVTELWTFVRPTAGGAWVLSAIQQAG